MKEQQNEISPQSKISRTSGLLSSGLDLSNPGIVVLDAERSRYYGMESVAGRIWELLEQECSVQALVDAVAEEYEVAREDCLADTISFLETLRAKGLITVG